MKKLIFALIITLIGGFALGSCKAPPVEEMNKAIDAVARAENDKDAVTYAANSLARAKDALNRMNQEAAAKRYDQAKSLAAEAVSLAEKAIADGKTGAARARDEAVNLIAVVGSEITATEGELAAATNAGNLALDTNALGKDLETCKNGLDEAKQSANNENYRDAINKAQPIRPALAEIRTKINGAAVEAGRKK